MATVTGIVHIAIRVANTAGDLTLFAVIQREAMQAQQGWSPGLGCVTILAFQTKEPGMNGWLGMALDANLWRAREDPIGVTILAADLSVFPLQGEDGFVTKRRHTIDAIMARGAVSPILLLVLEHEVSSLFSLRVAAHTASQIKVLDFPQMTVVAIKRVAIVLLLVANQAKPCLSGVLKRRSFPTRWRPTIWAMAASTIVRDHTRVRVIFSMAACAIYRGASEAACR